jgi:two-component system, NarL family, invasion response regulator UvrY
MRILIADDHAVVRHGLKQILAGAFKRASFGEAADSQQTLERVWKERWDVVILDLTMPGRSGLQVLVEIKRAYPKLPVLILSIHPEDQFAVRLLKAGAAGYLTKETAPEELVGAVRKAIAGGRYISPGLADKMASLLVNEAPGAPHEKLSDREFLILNLIASGKSVSVIARELSLSVKTISTYRGRVLEKMGLSNNAQLVHYAFQNRLVRDRPQDLSEVGAAAMQSLGPPRPRTGITVPPSRIRSPNPFGSS